MNKLIKVFRIIRTLQVSLNKVGSQVPSPDLVDVYIEKEYKNDSTFLETISIKPL